MFAVGEALIVLHKQQRLSSESLLLLIKYDSDKKGEIRLQLEYVHSGGLVTDSLKDF